MPGMETLPPAGPPWDLPLSEAALSFVDLETTGLSAESDRIVEICIERVQTGSVVGRLLTLVRSERHGGEAVHGIRHDQTVCAPVFADLADRIRELLAGAVVVAHGARQDIAFLEAEFARARRPWSCDGFVDTLALARTAFPAERHSLVALSQALAIDNPEPHRAGNDVAVLRGLWQHLEQELAPPTARDLLRLQRAPRRPVAEIVGAAERAAAHAKAVRVRYRPSGRAAEWLLFRVTAVRTDLDPPRVLGYLLHTRGRRELVGDRILAIEPVGRE